MDKNYKIDMTCRTNRDYNVDRKYFSYVFIALILSGLFGVMSLIVGCGNKPTTVGSGIQVLPVVEQVQPSTIKYDTPFISFEYPAGFAEDQKLIKSLNTIITVYSNENIYTDESKQIHIMLMKDVSNNINAKNAIVKRVDYYLQNKNAVITHDFKNIGDILYCELIIYEKGNSIGKYYAWDDGKGKAYVVVISGYESNRDNIDKVAQVFEKSIKFKQ